MGMVTIVYCELEDCVFRNNEEKICCRGEISLTKYKYGEFSCENYSPRKEEAL